MPSRPMRFSTCANKSLESLRTQAILSSSEAVGFNGQTIVNHSSCVHIGEDFEID